jgi:methylene-fatty-acyl-phospholipid synthase
MLFPSRDDLFVWSPAGFVVRSAQPFRFYLVVRSFPPRFHQALIEQPHKAMLPESWAIIVPAALFILGQTFVITSTWALGVTGTFLGDYFGILMDHRVDGFPFNILTNPMYVGSTMCFAATALWQVPVYQQKAKDLLTWRHDRYERPAGLLVTLYVYIVYIIALRFEGLVIVLLHRCFANSSKWCRPFTDMIYSNRAAAESSKKDS